MSAPRRLSRIVIRNYRSIGFCDLRLGDLTYLVGRNGSGKSNLLDALKFVKEERCQVGKPGSGPSFVVSEGKPPVSSEALARASGTSQVIVTSHSPDLLDDASIGSESVLAVSSSGGETVARSGNSCRSGRA